jgi:predicted phage terminase large subunit-like protein
MDLSGLGLPGRDALLVQLARRNLLDFTSYTFPGYRANWHHEVMCEALDDLIFGDTRRLMIFCPPRHGKSELVSRRLPAFFLGNYPQSEVIISSYSADLANRMNSSVQQIIDTPEYRRIFPHVRLPGGIGDPARRFTGIRKSRTTEYFELVGNRGSLRSAGVGGGITGMGFNLGIIDDPVKDSEEGMSQVMRDKVWDWYQTTFLTRQTGFGMGRDGKARILLTMTRWHEDDLAGRLLRLAREDKNADQWRVVILPGLSGDSVEDYADYDIRTAPGQALWEDSPYNADFLEGMRRNTANFFWQAMYQQRPISEGAGYFQREWFESNTFRIEDGWIFRDNKHPIQLSDCLVVGACDPASSEKQRADFTVVLVMAITPDGDGLILDVLRERANPAEIPSLLDRAARKWPIGYFVFESDGFQTAVVSIARRDYLDLPPIREVRHQGKGKLVRATTSIVRAEQRALRVPEEAKWLNAFLDELVAFTGQDDRHDDQVDALSYAVDEFRRFGGMGWVDVSRGAVRPYQKPQQSISNSAKRGLWGRNG